MKKKPTAIEVDVKPVPVPCAEIALLPDGLPACDPRRYMEDGFRDAFFRSQEVRENLWQLKPRAAVKIKEILELDPNNEKTLPTQFAAAKYVLDTSIIKYPDVSHKTVEVHDNRPPPGMVPYRAVSREEVIEAAVVAIEAEGHRGESTDDRAGGVSLDGRRVEPDES